MANLTEGADAARTQMWSELKNTRTGMLWMRDTDQHPQPMTHFADPENGALWFITSADTDLVSAIGHGAEAGFTMVSPDQDYHASLCGSLVVYESEEKLDELWSLAAAAWFERGREDPKVTLLKLSPREAAVWATDGNPVIVGLKMMRAALTEGKSHPAVGTHHVLDLALAA